MNIAGYTVEHEMISIHEVIAISDNFDSYIYPTDLGWVLLESPYLPMPRGESPFSRVKMAIYPVDG
jgi:hypothetical protein